MPENPTDNHSPEDNTPLPRIAWWRSIGPALITACVVFGPGSLLLSSKVGAVYGYELLWFLLITGTLMATFLTMGARIGVCGGASPCTLLAQRLGRPSAAVVGITLSLICGAFQFSNNVALAMAVKAIFGEMSVYWVVIGVNLVIIVFLLTASEVYKALERAMKVMVGLILLCFVFNLVVAGPQPLAVLTGFVPRIPEGLELGLPKKIDGQITDPMLLIAGLLGTTFSVAGAFFQGNLVRERNWTLADYRGSVGDALTGVGVLTLISMIIMVTAGTVIRGQPADDIGELALTLRPLLGNLAFWVFCIGLTAVALNPFVINAVIGGTILADGIGLPARIKDRWPRIFTVVVMLLGMVVAVGALSTGTKPLPLIIFGQAMTVLGNPLMALAMLWLANRRDVMGNNRNGWLVNLLGVLGFVVVLLMALRVLYRLVLQFV